jgi:fumarate hydratase subunit beta
MDAYTPLLLAQGVNAMIGKGVRSPEVRAAIVRYKAVYLVTYGGAGALLAGCIRQVEVVAYPELGAEAVMRLKIENFPALVADDIYGGDLFENEISRYSRYSGG